MKSIKNLLPRLILTLLVIISSPGTGGAKDDCAIDPISDKKIFSEKNNLIRVSVGDVFSIILESNPATGYSWTFLEPPDEEVVELLDEQILPPDNLRKGAPGKQKLTFQAVGKGNTVISLGYARPWEREKPPSRTTVFSVVVQNFPDYSP